MIVNHKDAIEFLVNEGGGVGSTVTRSSIFTDSGAEPSPDPGAPGSSPYGRRYREVDFPSSGTAAADRGVFQPPAGRAAAIRTRSRRRCLHGANCRTSSRSTNVNKRVSRLSANIRSSSAICPSVLHPMCRGALYTDAVLGIYD